MTTLNPFCRTAYGAGIEMRRLLDHARDVQYAHGSPEVLRARIGLCGEGHWRAILVEMADVAGYPFESCAKAIDAQASRGITSD